MLFRSKKEPGFLGLDKNRLDSIADALMAAGFGMMAGKSTNAWENIGAGGLKGIEAYQAGEAIRARREAEQNKLLEKRMEEERGRKYLETFVGKPSPVRGAPVSSDTSAAAPRSEIDATYDEIERYQRAIADAPISVIPKLKQLQEGLKMKLQRLKEARAEQRLAHEKSPEGKIGRAHV